MGYPIITRLGINQFWYNYWYRDKSFSLEINNDISFEVLLNTYLQYGLAFQNNIFLHEYWYSKAYKKFRINKVRKMDTVFYKRFYYTNEILNIEHSLNYRCSTAEYFPMRLWILKYDNWVILSVKWYKPLKIKSHPKRYDKGSGYIGSVTYSNFVNFTNRIKLVYMYFYFFFVNKYKKFYLF